MGSFNPELLKLANQAQVHRGPDDSGEYVDIDTGVGLAHVRLSILDLSQEGHQPMVLEDGSLTLVFNGEIYNFRELREDLEIQGVKFRGNSDTEVLLQLYLSLGDAMLKKLNGIFAFAIWDKRTHSLFLARDGLGVKPLYYAESSKGFVFASEIKALLCIAPELRDLDVQSLHRYMSFLWCPGEGTPLSSVRKLEPGAAMFIRDCRIIRHWYWYKLPLQNDVQFIPSSPDLVSGVADKLRQLVADVPVGAFLSGGLDSSAIVSFAREQLPDIQCYTIETSGLENEGIPDDLPYAREVAKHLNVSLDVVQIDANKMAGDLERMITQLDEPLADPAPLNVLYISQLARKQGIKVLLSGAGGDDIFSGYRRHVAVNYEHYWNWLPQSTRQTLEKMTQRTDQRVPFFRRLAKLFDGSGMDGDARLANYFVWAGESVLSGLYSPEFREQLGPAIATAPMLEFLQKFDKSIHPLERMLALEQRFFLTDHNLNYTDKMSMATGVETRVPFLDPDLMNYAAGIPTNWKQHGRVSKWILKKSMEPYLPKNVIYRPKSGFGAPLRQWMRRELRPLLNDVLSKESLKKRGIFNPSAVQDLLRKNDSGEIDGAYSLLPILTIELWCRTYLDSNGTGRLS